MRAAALAFGLTALLASAPLAYGHCYSIWKNPWPQHCGGVYARSATKDKTWFVEITQPPPLPPDKDERTPEQIADQAEHDAAVKAHHDEINFLIGVLLSQERITGQ